ncbi:MAG: hypothetical protein IPG64_11380 [Haliea sp.]|nr:hypothetical protein [Haliea sp.]
MRASRRPPAAHAALLALQPFDTLAENGDTVSLDLVVSGLGNFGPDSLGAFDIFVGYDTGALSFAGYTLGNLLGRVDLFEAIDASGGAGGGAVNIAEVSLLSATSLNTPQPGQFVLASLRFDVLDLMRARARHSRYCKARCSPMRQVRGWPFPGTTQATISRPRGGAIAGYAAAAIKRTGQLAPDANGQTAARPDCTAATVHWQFRPRPMRRAGAAVV